MEAQAGVNDEREQDKGLKIYFNPFAFTIEENNEFLRLGWEPAPIAIPPADRRRELS